MADAEEQPTRIYRGNCHCGAFVFEAELPEITSVYACNCSICTKKGYLGVMLNNVDKFKAVKGDEDEDLTSYRFGSQMATHKFCPTCATPVFLRAGPQTMMINAHALQDIDTRSLKRIPYDGQKIGSPYEPPAHKGSLPTADIENGKLYTGGCHCGAVTLALKSKPLDETYDEKVVECNCSICERNGYFWIYPKVEQVVLAGLEADIGRYTFARHIIAKTFCRKCGVNLTNVAIDLSPDEFAALSDEAKMWHERVRKIHAINVRVLPGAEMGKMTAVMNNIAAIPPVYVNP